MSEHPAPPPPPKPPEVDHRTMDDSVRKLLQIAAIAVAAIPTAICLGFCLITYLTHRPARGPIAPPVRRPHAIICHENLAKIDGAKAMWMLEKKITDENASPMWRDLVGPELFMHTHPVCPDGGVYSIGTLKKTPTCSLSTQRGDAHSLP